LGFVLWVKDELPLALVKEQAEGEIAADKSDDNDCGDGFHKPGVADQGL